MRKIYQNILDAIASKRKLLAVLIDPDKMDIEKVSDFMAKVNTSIVTHIFVGGSVVEENDTEILVSKIKKLTALPVIVFPGDVSQITEQADAILFLSLISGRQAEYLIGKHVKAVSKLRQIDLEIIPTGYILIENGKKTSVEKVTGTQPMSRDNIPLVVDTALAGEFLGKKLIYLEAGSGATHPIDITMISEVKKALQIPLIVGGGIRTKEQLLSAYNSGADIVVIGTALEDDESFFNELV
ncbi:Phosphoglycerol geranylgeranyltransferase [hydrothermal vent metagenome]|uniref:phosphoglycerol geranylgeranyltransferase n=1 Tax=hydrothermal vent metagenome TaxID=652676 RepID=A0A3B0QX52_9ZZZZ